MVRVQFNHKMEQQRHNLQFLVKIGSMKMKSKTIHFMVCVTLQKKKEFKLDFRSLVWSTDRSKQEMIAYSPISIFQVQLPPGNGSTYSLELIVFIRDRRDCLTQWNSTSVSVLPDPTDLNNLINNLAGSSVRLLSAGNTNTVDQVINSLSQQLNQMNTENLDNAVSSN